MIVMKKPVIGITTRTDSLESNFYLRHEYSEAVYRLGGTPFHIPLIASEEYLSQVVCIVDGILLPGSDSDIDPLHFNQEPQKKLGNVRPLRDMVDLQLLEMAENLQMPVLGICFGMQALNVHRRGTLIQDIESEISDSIQHQQGEPKARLSHYVYFEQNSFFSSLSGKSKALVNSHHHQAIADLGENLRITARASDQVIEAIEDVRSERFIIGVQWHPELNWQTDDLSEKIFKAFVEAAARFGSTKTANIRG
jgi:putative glutamine amidotransferase